jgi:hypothetical protein
MRSVIGRLVRPSCPAFVRLRTATQRRHDMKNAISENRRDGCTRITSAIVAGLEQGKAEVWLRQAFARRESFSSIL